MTPAELHLMRRRLWLTGQQSVFLAALVDAPDGRVQRADMEVIVRMGDRCFPYECISSPGAILKVVMCKVNRALPSRCRITGESGPRKGRVGRARIDTYVLPQEGRDYVLRAISEAERYEARRKQQEGRAA